MLLHFVDIAPLNPDIDPVKEARAIVEELQKYDESLYRKPRWLVLNKADMLPPEERDAAVAEFVRRFRWKGPHFLISALTDEGCRELCFAVMDHLEKQR